MKRIQDKVKDIVEVRPFKSIRDFTADPAETLANYHFTDATADLMAKWLEGIAAVQSRSGVAFALAGYRGVGKSHFLATLGALASSPELRSRVSESHVEFSAQRLQRRHYPVSHLRRGTHKTLLEELKAAVIATFQFDSLDDAASFEDVLAAASRKAGESPWILLIDTALERGSRITRDDGEDLSRIGEFARTSNLFVGVALDDDIAGADGSNSAIVRSFSIDYLDQAHLYKVVNAHIFPKHGQKQPVLHDIYGYFREVLPSFRWSEQKFSALYPLHPAILEVAPYVRLYVHDFALLGFASEAGERILGRPANSLIALDEVYDNAEAGLRKIEDLQEAFAAYDHINSTVVNKIPVMHRLQAKLVLKALLLLSLDGQGGTASDICASELIFDESDPANGVAAVTDLLKTFADALPEEFRVVSEDGAETRYSFKVSSKENLNNALTEAVLEAPAEAVTAVLKRVFQDRFSEASPTGEAAESGDLFRAHLIWRGARRSGSIIWGDARGPDLPTGNEWEVRIDLGGGSPPADSSALSRVIWKPDELRPDEADKLRSYHVLSSSVELREKFSEQIRASIHAHSIAAEKILTRAFLEDGKLVIDGFDYNFTEEARSAQTLSEMFSLMLEPLFETLYPSHPYFTRVLDHDDVASIVTDLYNATRRDLADVQSRAQTFAFPLGLVRLEGTSFLPEAPERLAALPMVREVLGFVDGNPRSASLAEVSELLQRRPYGLGLEGQQMLLTSLVAERFIEFVTKSGNRINRRSLDLRIIWDDIVGIARPLETSASGAILKSWAKLFLRDKAFASFDSDADRETLVSAFAEWSRDWENARTLEQFAELPEDLLNVRVWQLAAKASKTFGAVSEKIRDAAAEAISPEECIEHLVEVFSGSETEFETGLQNLRVLESFVRGTALREEARAYLLMSEATGVDEIEELRAVVISLIDSAVASPDDAINRELGYAWDKFRRAYGEYFGGRHKEVMNSPERNAAFAETMKSAMWAEFDILVRLPGFDQRYALTADGYRARLHALDCRIDNEALLQAQPFCHCCFALNGFEDADHLPDALNDSVREGLSAFRQMLLDNADYMTSALEKLTELNADPGLADPCRELIASMSAGKRPGAFNDLHLKALSAILKQEGRVVVGTGMAGARPTQAPPAGKASTAVTSEEDIFINI